MRTVSACFAVLRQIRSVRPQLHSKANAAITGRVAGGATPRLRQRNTIWLSGIPNRSSAVRSDARLISIYSLPKCDHVTPLLRELHWLEIRQRIDYKLAVRRRCNPPAFFSVSQTWGLAGAFVRRRRVSSLSLRRNFPQLAIAPSPLPLLASGTVCRSQSHRRRRFSL